MGKSPSCFVTKVDLLLKDRIENDLKEQGFTLGPLSHGFFSAKKPGISCNLYHSGKLMVQGKNKDEFIEFYLEPEILKTVEYTHRKELLDRSARMGLDEAGKGDFFGPLCLAAIFVPEGEIDKLEELGVKDSKKIQDATILKVAAELKKNFQHKVLRLFPETYNRQIGRAHV